MVHWYLHLSEIYYVDSFASHEEKKIMILIFCIPKIEKYGITEMGKVRE